MYLHPMPRDNSFDTIAGIADSLGSLDAFRALLKKRDGYGREDYPMHAFLVLGRWFLGARGDFGFTEVSLPGGECIDPACFAEVVSVDQLKACFKDIHIFYDGRRLPEDKDRCPGCGRGWTLDNLHDSFEVMEREKCLHFHRKCKEIDGKHIERKRFSDLFRKAGFPTFVLNDIPNEYWRPSVDCIPPPWFLVELPEGDIKIGKRKNVINIDTSKFSKIDCSELFEKEKADVTVWKDGIHAWGDEKAVEYLTKIRKAAENLAV